MTILFQERASDSPYVEKVTRGWTLSAGESIRPAETQWHLVFVKQDKNVYRYVVGPLTKSGTARWGGGAEILWIKFKLGTFMPELPARNFLDMESPLEPARGKSFWLNGCTWEAPTFENADTFVNKLVGAGVLTRDRLVHDVLRGQASDLSLRTVRHRFLRATGLSQVQVEQFDRAQRAAELLRTGTSILDTVHEAGYFDQPHLTRALKHWLGYTPSQIYLPGQ